MSSADTKTGHVCRDHGEVDGCLGVADPRYTMDFTDVEPGAYIYWCAACGPQAAAMNDALQSAMANRPGFADKLEHELRKHAPS